MLKLKFSQVGQKNGTQFVRIKPWEWGKVLKQPYPSFNQELGGVELDWGVGNLTWPAGFGKNPSQHGMYESHEWDRLLLFLSACYTRGWNMIYMAPSRAHDQQM